MWPFKTKEKIPFVIVMEMCVQNMVTRSPFLNEEILTKIGDRRVLGGEVLKRLPAEIIYFSTFLVIHFCLTRPYGLKKSFEMDGVVKAIEQASHQAFASAPDSLRVHEELFPHRYKFYTGTSKIENAAGEKDSLVRAFCWVTLGIDDDEVAETPEIKSKLAYLEILGDVMFDMTDDIVGGMVKDKE
ncbi:MAG: hypothetical protein IH623_26745, partial [Verrucomicrobia bacterium]|nr:hypothetical protein [Verrucomicrobiota bacterium]